MSDAYGLTDETYTALRAEFIDWLDSELLNAETCISEYSIKESNAPQKESNQIRLMRIAHNIKGSSGAFGFTAISAIAHRFEDFMSSTQVDLHSEKYRDMLLEFIDQMRYVSELEHNLSEEETTAILRKLPSSTTYATPNATNEQTSTQLQKEAIIISPSRTITAISRKVFETLGHGVVAAKSGIEGLSLTLNIKPDFVVLSTVMSGISGPDLARGISHMKALKDTKVILVTNLDNRHPDMQDIPNNVSIIYHAGNFPMELFKVIKDLS